MISVLVADDHAVVRKGVKLILGETIDIRVEGEASNGLEAFQLAVSCSFDVLLLDIIMPGRSNGLEVLKELKRHGSKLPVLMFSIHADEQYGVHALRAGAAGYLNKCSPSEELVKAVRRVAAGGRYISPVLADAMAQRLDGLGNGQPHERLSEREFEVLIGLAAGKTATEIARELMLSVKTVSTYRTRILEKLCARGTSELVHYAIQHGLVPALDLNDLRSGDR
jgi:two-component system invasion response regulator UvrY